MQDPEVPDRKELRLDHRHLTFFFVGAVAVCAVFFALGFVVGRGQAYEVSMKAQSAAAENSLDRTPAERSPQALQTPKSLPEQPPLVPKETALPVSDPAKVRKEGVPDYPKELDFYSGMKGQKVGEDFHPAPKEASKSASNKPSSAAKSGAPRAVAPPAKSVSVGKLLSLQVAAFSSPKDAENLSKTLRAKGYAVFLVRPGNGAPDQLIRVQVGPFKGESETAAVKAQLEKDGYKTITKH